MPKQASEIKLKIAKRVAAELKENQVVNLGVGIPTLVPDYIGDKNVFLQSENGLLGMGPTPPETEIDMDLISASKKPITMIKGASLFDSADSFAMIRGGHVDVAVLGGLEVDETGEIANWAVPGQSILGVGGAMDLVAGAKSIIITMSHQAKDGSPKLVKELSFPRSGVQKANLIITEKAVFEVKHGKLYCTEMIDDISIEQLKSITAAHFEMALTKTEVEKG